MKKHISLLIAVIMVLTLVYTPAGVVYAAEEDGVQPAQEQTEQPEAAESADEVPAAEVTNTDPAPAAEPEETNQVGEGTVPGEETTGSDTEGTEEIVNGTDEEGTPNEEPPQNEEPVEIAKLTVTKQTATSIGLSWEAVEDATSYKVFLIDEEQTTNPEVSEGTVTATVTGLTPKTDYPFTIKAYKEGKEEAIAEGTFAEDKSYTSPKNPAKPAKLTASIVYTDKGKDKGYYLKYKLTSSKVSGIKGGYLFQYTISGTTYKKALTANTYVVPKIFKNKKKQNFYVRAYDKYRDKTAYSAWTKCSITAATTRWRAVLPSGKKYGKKYYYVNGIKQENKEIWITKKLKYYFDKNGVWRGGSKYMWNRCKKQTSGTDTMVVTSRNRHTVCIFKKIGGTWCCQYEWLCSVGEKGNRTPHGAFYVRNKKKSFGKGHTCWYATRYHKKYPKAAFHSVLYKTGSKTKIKDGRLGKDISNGCVRLALKCAKWIYDNVKKKSRIYIY